MTRPLERFFLIGCGGLIKIRAERTHSRMTSTFTSIDAAHRGVILDKVQIASVDPIKALLSKIIVSWTRYSWIGAATRSYRQRSGDEAPGLTI